jgi:HSP20 family protein
MAVKEVTKNGEVQKLPARREEVYTYPGVFREMDEWMSRWDRLFGSFFNRAWGLAPSRVPESWNMRPADWTGFTPALNISETEEALLITAELPGINEKDIELTVDHGVLAIKGEKRQETEDKGTDYYRKERTYGKFQRSISLPDYVDVDEIEAAFKNGVLTLTLAKRPELQHKPRKIEIHPGK